MRRAWRSSRVSRADREDTMNSMKHFACALAIALGIPAGVFAQGQTTQRMATGSDAVQAGENRIVIRNGKAFLEGVIGAPPEGLPLDTSVTPLALNVFT